MDIWLKHIAAGATLMLAACGTHAATPTATPATVQGLLEAARPGDVIRLAPGNYDKILLEDKSWSPPVVVEAGAATLKSMRVVNVSGLTWHGGTFDGGDVERNAFSGRSSQNLVVDGIVASGYVRNAIGMGKVSDVRLTNNKFTKMGSDGIQVALSRRVVIDHNSCTDFTPTEGAHPDCIQIWSNPSDPPTADFVITNNTAIGSMQGIGAFNHVRQGIDDGGYDRITVTNNFVRSNQHNGITLSSCRDCVVRDNRVETLPNPKFPRTRSWLRADGSVDMCGNSIAAFPKFPGQQRCTTSARKTAFEQGKGQQ